MMVLAFVIIVVWIAAAGLLSAVKTNFNPICLSNVSGNISTLEPSMFSDVGMELEPTNPSRMYETWMDDHYEELQTRTLFDITLPGTHDSAGYHFDGSTLYNVDPIFSILVKVADLLHIPVESIIVKWSQTQMMKIYDQLMGGIRYLDMRGVWDGMEWRIYHGVAGDSISSILNEIILFMDNHAHEILVIELSVYSGSSGGDVCELSDLIQSKLSRFLLDSTYDLNRTTIQDMIEARKRIVFGFSGKDICRMFPIFHNADDIIKNTFADSDNYETMRAFNERQVGDFVSSHQSNSTLFKMSWTLTPQTDTIIGSILQPNAHAHNLYELAVSANARFQGFVANMSKKLVPLLWNRPFVPANIIVCDFWNVQSALIETTIALNFPQYKYEPQKNT
eukprot:CFRG2559T1